MNHLGHYPIGYLGEIGLQRVRNFLKLGPEGFVHKPLRNPGHYGGVSLAFVSVRADAVSAKERHKYLSRPHVPHGKPILERRILFFNLSEAFQNTLSGPGGGFTFARSGRAGVERFYQSELFDEFGFVHHRWGSSILG